MKSLHIILYVAAIVLTLTSCSEYGRGKSTIESFLSEGLSREGINSLQVVKADTTLFLTDSAALAMRQSVAASGQYKKDLKYASLPLPEKLIFITVHFRIDGDTTQMSHTFYLDEQQDSIYCLKIDAAVGR